MRGSLIKWYILAAGIAATVSVGLRANARTFAQPPGTWSGPVDTVQSAQEMLLAFFPELKGHDYPMQIGMSQSFDRPAFSEQLLMSFDITVEESVAAFKPITIPTVRDHLLGGHWEFSREVTSSSCIYWAARIVTLNTRRSLRK